VAFGYWGIDWVIDWVIDVVVGLLIGSAHFKGGDMSQQSEALKERTMLFAMNVLRLIDKFPDTPGARVIAFQLAKCSTSVGANYRAVCNARSRAEFIAKLGTVVEEADESVYWLEIVNRLQFVPGAEVRAALQESIELRAIFSRSSGTARANARERSMRSSMIKSMSQ
jgi:four helix bundle protein